jgi:hypothetical protein
VAAAAAPAGASPARPPSTGVSPAPSPGAPAAGTAPAQSLGAAAPGSTTGQAHSFAAAAHAAPVVHAPTPSKAAPAATPAKAVTPKPPTPKPATPTPAHTAPAGRAEEDEADDSADEDGEDRGDSPAPGPLVQSGSKEGFFPAASPTNVRRTPEDRRVEADAEKDLAATLSQKYQYTREFLLKFQKVRRAHAIALRTVRLTALARCTGLHCQAAGSPGHLWPVEVKTAVCGGRAPAQRRAIAGRRARRTCRALRATR